MYIIRIIAQKLKLTKHFRIEIFKKPNLKRTHPLNPTRIKNFLHDLFKNKNLTNDRMFSRAFRTQALSASTRHDWQVSRETEIVFWETLSHNRAFYIT